MKNKPVWRLVLLSGAVMLALSHGPRLFLKTVGVTRSTAVPWMVEQWKALWSTASALELPKGLWETRTLGLFLILLGMAIVVMVLVRLWNGRDPVLAARRLAARGVSEVEIGRATGLSRDAVRQIIHLAKRGRRHETETFSAPPRRQSRSGPLGRPSIFSQLIDRRRVPAPRLGGQEAVRVLQK